MGPEILIPNKLFFQGPYFEFQVFMSTLLFNRRNWHGRSMALQDVTDSGGLKAIGAEWYVNGSSSNSYHYGLWWGLGCCSSWVEAFNFSFHSVRALKYSLQWIFYLLELSRESNQKNVIQALGWDFHCKKYLHHKEIDSSSSRTQ